MTSRPRHPFFVSLLFSLGLLLALGCGGEEVSTPEPTVATLGLFNLPVSRLNDADAPREAHRIQITPEELAFSGRPLLELARGSAPASAVRDGQLEALREAIRRAPRRSSASVSAHAMVDYGLWVQQLATLLDAGIRELSVEVRPSGAASESGWMNLNDVHLLGPEENLEVEPGASPDFASFSSQWGPIYRACRAGRYIDCDGVPIRSAEGGQAMVVLWTRGQGMQVRFRQLLPPEAQLPQDEAGSESDALADSAPPSEAEQGAGEQAGEGEENLVPPASEGAFMFRISEAVSAEDSAISNVTRPVCGASACRVIVEADAGTPLMRVISLLGAAFPNGSTPPRVYFRRPSP